MEADKGAKERIYKKHLKISKNMRGVIEAKNIDHLAWWMHNCLPEGEPFIIEKHVPKEHHEWFTNSVEAWAEIRFGWLSNFKIEMTKDKKAIRKIKI